MISIQEALNQILGTSGVSTQDAYNALIGQTGLSIQDCSLIVYVTASDPSNPELPAGFNFSTQDLVNVNGGFPRGNSIQDSINASLS